MVTAKDGVGTGIASNDTGYRVTPADGVAPGDRMSLGNRVDPGDMVDSWDMAAPGTA